MIPLIAAFLLLTPISGIDIGICHLQDEHDFGVASHLHFSWHRSSIPWASIQIKMWGYDYYWKEADEMVNHSIKYELQTIWTLAFTPWWCSSKPNASIYDKDYYTYPPKDMNSWYEFVKKIATRYKGKITAWEIWNEEDLNYFWKGSVEQYVEITKYAYLALKEVDENNTVVMGGLALANAGEGEYNPHFLEEFLSLGGGNYVDVYAFHVYGNSFMKKYEYMKNTLNKFNESKPLWITEFGASTCSHCYNEIQQAFIIMHDISQFQRFGIEKAMIYELKDTTSDDEWESHLGILHTDYSPKIVVYFLLPYLYFNNFLNSRAFFSIFVLLNMQYASPSFKHICFSFFNSSML